MRYLSLLSLFPYQTQSLSSEAGLFAISYSCVERSNVTQSEVASGWPALANHILNATAATIQIFHQGWLDKYDFPNQDLR